MHVPFKLHREIFITKLGATIIIIIMICLGAITYNMFEDNSENQRSVQNTYEIIGLGKELLSIVKDAETSTRGYVISGKEEFLEPFYTSLERQQWLQSQLCSWLKIRIK